MHLIPQKLKIIGRREFACFPSLNMNQLVAKIDNGAYSNAIHCMYIELKENKLYVKFLNDEVHVFSDFAQKKIKNSSGEMEERFIIQTTIHLGGKKINTRMSLTDRGNMRYPILIGRRLLKRKFLVDVNLIFTNGL
jgi:hypothetical protein